MSTRECDACGTTVVVNDAVDETLIRIAMANHQRFCTSTTPPKPARRPVLEAVQTPDPVQRRPHPRELLTHPSKQVAKAAAKVIAAAAALDKAWADDAAKAELRAERDQLKKQLAAVERRLRAPAKTDGPRDWKTIRAWAQQQGLDCPTTGKVPNAVLEAYDEAHTLRKATT